MWGLWVGGLQRSVEGLCVEVSTAKATAEFASKGLQLGLPAVAPCHLSLGAHDLNGCSRKAQV